MDCVCEDDIINASGLTRERVSVSAREAWERLIWIELRMSVVDVPLRVWLVVDEVSSVILVL